MLIQPKFLTLSELLAKRMFRIPEYQRAYSWHTKQREDLFDDITKLQGADQDATHFMATVVGLNRGSKRIMTDNYQTLEIVDGQQRLTTLILLHRAIAKALDPKNRKQKKLAQEIEELLVKEDDLSLLLLQTNHDSSDYFANYLRKGTYPSPKEAKTLADRALLEAMVECESYVASWSAHGIDGLFELAAILKNGLTFIFHEIHDEAAVYTVFEVLNSRGLDVSWLDRMKSIIMAVAFSANKGNRKDTIKELHDIWKRIYACIGLRQGMSTEALRFAATLKSGEAPSRVLSEEDAVDTLEECCGESPKDAVESSQWIERVATAVDALLSDRRRAAVTKIGHARLLAVAIELRGFPKQKRQDLLDQWERVTFRIFGMFSKDARTKVGDYVRLAWRITEEKPSADEVLVELKALGEDFDIKGAVAELADADCYDGWQEELRYFLYRYEEHLAAEAGQKFKNEQWVRIWDESASTSIEHIYPQSKAWPKSSKTKIYAHRLGNLLLLPPGLNSKLSDKDPAEKASDYRKTGLLIAQSVADKAKRWDRDEVEQREKRMLAWATKTWAD